MARGAAPPKTYSDAYRRRIIRALGITPEEARSRGISLQKARGHSDRSAAPGKGEKAQTAARQRARGELTETDRRFLRRQMLRGSPIYERRRVGNTVQFVEIETTHDRYQRALAAYRAMSPEERDQLREMQARLVRANRRRGFRIDDFEGEDFDWPDFDDDIAPLYFYH